MQTQAITCSLSLSIVLHLQFKTPESTTIDDFVCALYTPKSVFFLLLAFDSHNMVMHTNNAISMEKGQKTHHLNWKLSKKKYTKKNMRKRSRQSIVLQQHKAHNHRKVDDLKFAEWCWNPVELSNSIDSHNTKSHVNTFTQRIAQTNRQF